MRSITSMLRLLLPGCALVIAAGTLDAAELDASGFGNVSIPDPVKPANADSCVEPVEIMRRDHMKFLLHLRDETVIGGERGSKYSLVGCMDCHNPAGADGEIVRYEDPQHFCAECHAYTSVKIDCFECHADRGLSQSQQSRADALGPAWDTAGSTPAVSTLQRRPGTVDGD